MAPDPELLLPQSVADVYLMWPNTSSSEMGKTSSLELGGEHAPAIEYAACEDADAANKHTWTTTDTFMQQMQECETTPSKQMKENREPELDATISITVSSAVLLMEQERKRRGRLHLRGNAGNASICEHNSERSQCKDCEGTSICDTTER